jgi:hypothetical protein
MLNKKVDVLVLGKAVQEVEVGPEATIQDALDKAGIAADKVLADGKDANFDDLIGETKVITAVPNVKGGQ